MSSAKVDCCFCLLKCIMGCCLSVSAYLVPLLHCPLYMQRQMHFGNFQLVCDTLNKILQKQLLLPCCRDIRRAATIYLNIHRNFRRTISHICSVFETYVCIICQQIACVTYLVLQVVCKVIVLFKHKFDFLVHISIRTSNFSPISK